LSANSPTKSSRDLLISLFRKHTERINENICYCKRLAHWFHWGSRALLISAVITFGFGSLAPFLDRICPNHNMLFWGYAAIVVAGLMFGADRAFLASQGWSRFILAKIQLEALRNRLELQQEKFDLTITDDAAARDQVPSVTDLLEKNEQERASIVESETKAWASEFAAALADFGKKIATAIAEAAKTRDAAAMGSGVVSVEFTEIPTDASRISVRVGGESQDMATANAKLVFENQLLGPRAIRVRWQRGGSQREIQEGIVVKPGEVTNVKIAIPTN
jgi:hypothetical protein